MALYNISYLFYFYGGLQPRVPAPALRQRCDRRILPRHHMAAACQVTFCENENDETANESLILSAGIRTVIYNDPQMRMHFHLISPASFEWPMASSLWAK